MPHSPPSPAPEVVPPPPARRARRRRVVLVVAALVGLVLVGLGAVAWYVRHHRQAGLADLAAERPADARAHLDRALAA
ncbi:MAG: hypothetical protein K2X82_05350, partial [Gemmataceae bacterium]|nr:hypothetical protein [Gemmataceae bacterium]